MGVGRESPDVGRLALDSLVGNTDALTKQPQPLSELCKYYSCLWMSVAFQSTGMGLTTLAPCRELASLGCGIATLMRTQAGKEPASWIGSALAPARSKSEVTIFLVRNQRHKAGEQLMKGNYFS